MPKACLPETILVADDDAAIRGNLCLLLRDEGYQVREAADGQQALDALQDFRVTLTLLDLKMPLVDGREVLRQRAVHLEESPIIVITAPGRQRRGHRSHEARGL